MLPWWRRLVVRYAATFGAVAAGSALVVGVPLYGLAVQLTERALDDRLEGMSELAALTLPAEACESADPSVRSTLDTIREEADLDAVCLLAHDGTVRLVSAELPAACDLDPAERAVLASSLADDSAHTPLRADADGTPRLFAFAPVREGSACMLGVRASAPYLERLSSLRSLFAGAGLIWVGLIALLGAWSAGRLVRPILRLVEATRRLGAGERGPDGTTLGGEGGAVELVTLERAFVAMAGAVHERETRLRALAGNVAHEVRNPSHALRLHLGLLRRDLGDAPPRARARLATLEAELDQLDATVEAFLLFARDRAAHREPVDVRSLLAVAADGATVEAPSVSVSVDPVLLGRAVGNLVRNAREAGGEPIRVTATVDEALTITVEDHGPGFPPTMVDRAFEPFVAGRADGSGLGLAIVAAVAQAHGGTARILRSGADGTSVQLTIGLR